MAFKRIIKVVVGTSIVGGKSSEGLLISDLNIEFEVNRSINLSDNSCEVTIYNALPSTIENLLVKGNNIYLETGYEDEGSSSIFIGNILTSMSQKDGKERKTIVKAGGMQNTTTSLKYLTVQLSYASQTPISKIITELSVILGIIVHGARNAEGIILPNGFVYAGTVKKALAYCKKILKSNGIGLYIDNTELVVYRLGVQDSTFESVYLDKNSGLINAYLMNEDYRVGDTVENVPRVKYKSILHPRLVPNGLVTIKNDRINNTYRNEKVKFQGDNLGGEFTCTGEAVI